MFLRNGGEDNVSGDLKKEWFIMGVAISFT